MKKKRKRTDRGQWRKECFRCRGFGHMAYNYRNVGVEEPTSVFPNRFEVLKV